MKQEKFFMIQIIYWYETFWENFSSKYEMTFGPFSTKEEMNAEMHRVRDYFSKKRGWVFKNYKQMTPFKWLYINKWHSSWEYHDDVIGWKKIRSNNRMYWDNPYKGPSENPDGHVIGFWRTFPILKQGDSEVQPYTIEDHKSEKPLKHRLWKSD